MAGYKYSVSRLMIAALLGVCANVSLAAPGLDPERLNKDLTPVGAERAGNKDGSIPAWTGGLLEAPQGWVRGNGYIDPFANEKPLVVITAQNFEQYKDKLTPGDIALMKKYPTFKMPIYPTHRTAAFPKEVTDKMRKDLGKARVSGVSIEGYGGTGSPFLMPKSGVEVVYNHELRYFPSYKQSTHWVPVRSNGEYYTIRFSQQFIPKQFIEGKTFDNHLFTFVGYYESPASLLGTIYLIHDVIDVTKGERQAWIYNAGQRRVRRAPDVAYDNVDDGTEGMRTTDQFFGFNGGLDRYDWKLLGKKEIYVPYNTYKIAEKKLKYTDIFQKGSVNSDLMRYELHRVWVVDGTLKSGMSHVYGRRTFYFDEDSWAVVHEDAYDTRGSLWRVSTVPTFQRYDAGFPFVHFFITHDLNAGYYLATNFDNEVKSMPLYNVTVKWQDVQVDSLRRSGTR